jgi:hypothetical protein
MYLIKGPLLCQKSQKLKKNADDKNNLTLITRTIAECDSYPHQCQTEDDLEGWLRE